jgi:hypothetical protein
MWSKTLSKYKKFTLYNYMIYISFDIGIKNLALCILRHENDTLSIIDWRIITLADSKKQIKGVDKISEVLYYELDNIIGTLQGINENLIHSVIIENQPSNLNGIMKTIQMLIYSYFNLLKHWDKTVSEVVLINAVHKLQNHSYVPQSKQEPHQSNVSKRDKYKLNKADSIEICRNYCKDDTFLTTYFNAHKKKDDLADTCIQTISYLRKQGYNIEYVSLDVRALISLE